MLAENRSLTPRERERLTRALNTLPTGTYFGGGRWVYHGRTKPLDEPIDPAPYLGALDSLRIVSRCGCGEPFCHTVQFQRFRAGHTRVFIHIDTEADLDIITFVDEDSRELAEMEVIQHRLIDSSRPARSHP